jgi:hypothetical protein
MKCLNRNKNNDENFKIFEKKINFVIGCETFTYICGLKSFELYEFIHLTSDMLCKKAKILEL